MASCKASKDGFTLIELMIVVAIVGVLAVLAVYGVRRYISNAKTAEAKNGIGQMSKDAITKYEGEIVSGATMAGASTTGVVHDVCLSSSSRVPSLVPRGQKYQSTAADWTADATAVPAKGFSCLRFEMAQAQYYSYSYEGVSNTRFVSSAEGDLNGDGVTSWFHQDGAVINGRLHVAPGMTEVNPDE